jgi:hypothetical protein
VRWTCLFLVGGVSVEGDDDALAIDSGIGMKEERIQLLFLD